MVWNDQFAIVTRVPFASTRVDHLANAQRTVYTQSRNHQPSPKIRIQSLAAPDILGIPVRLTRITKTYPAGSLGNSQPIVTVDSYWTAKDLDIDLKIVSEDPRTGTRSIEATSISRNEPAPDVFNPPPGYAIRDQQPASVQWVTGPAPKSTRTGASISAPAAVSHPASAFTTNTSTAAPANPIQKPTAPFTASFLITTEQTSSDGSKVATNSTRLQARDADGRQLMSLFSPHPAYLTTAHDHSETTVIDPVARTSTHWTISSSTVQVSELPPARVVASISLEQQSPPSETRTPDPNIRVESLGETQILGVRAVGTRITRNIPIGRVGNDHPLLSVTERWLSPELGIILKEVHSDPKMGDQTTQVMELKLGPPDPSLFQPPADYKVVKPAPTIVHQVARD